MVLSPAEMIAYQDRLSRIRKARGFIDTSRVEQDFLSLSSKVQTGELTVEIPRTYKLSDEDANKLKEALKSSGIEAKIPSELGISGGFNGISNEMIFLLSNNQFKADYVSHNRAYLNPLLFKIYTEGDKLIRDFSLHETVFGKVKCYAGNLDLTEIKLFPERFQPGAYKLSVELDTPSRTIEDFIEYNKQVEEFRQKPEESIKDEKKVREITKRALKLRGVLGALSKCESQKSKVFSAQTNSVMFEDEKNTYFYLYNPIQKKNVLVYFGERPVIDSPMDLQILNAQDQQKTLTSLVNMDFYKVSTNILRQRIADISQLYSRASRIENKNLSSDYTDFGKLLDRLKINQRVIETMASEESRKKFALEQPAEILEFMVCPNNLDINDPEKIDPVIHDLLAHLSWNGNLRKYHDSQNFIKYFEKSSEKEKEEILIRVSSGLSFANQQNNDVNLWLYNNYKDFCKSHGINFKLL